MNINISLYKSRVIWFHINDAAAALIYSINTKPGECRMNTSFDYERVGAKYRYHIDVCLETMESNALFRVSFEFNYKGGSWDNVFNTDFILPMLEAAMEQSLRLYSELCISNQVKHQPFAFDEKTLKPMAEGMVQQYFNYRKKDDINNAYLMNTHGITFTSGNDTIVLLLTTIIILDVFFYDCTDFDNAHNQKVFEEVMHRNQYLTLKFNCLDITTKSVKLSFMSFILLLQSMDCAIKLLLNCRPAFAGSEHELRGLKARKFF